MNENFSGATGADVIDAPVPTGDVARWLRERCRFGRYASRSHYLYRSYRVWCLERRELPLTKSNWREAMTEAGFASERDNGGSMFRGVALSRAAKPEPEEV